MATGTATGTARQWCIAVGHITAMPRGMVATTGRTFRTMADTTLQPEHTHAEPVFRTRTELRRWVKLTTQAPAHTVRRTRAPMLMAVGEARRFRKMATQPIASIKLL